MNLHRAVFVVRFMRGLVLGSYRLHLLKRASREGLKEGQLEGADIIFSYLGSGPQIDLKGK